MDQLSAHIDRGWDLVARGELDAAKVSAEESLELDPQSPDAHNLMGYVFAMQGSAESALEHYRAALDADESFFEAMLNAAEVLVHPLGRLDEAIALMDEALGFLELPDEIVEAKLLKVDALLHKNDRESAKVVLASLPEGPFEAPHLAFLIGRALFESGDADRAEPSLLEAVRRDPASADAHYYLGLVAEQRGDRRSATIRFLEARAFDLQLGAPAWALPPSTFEQHVQAALGRLPKNAAACLEETLVVVCDVPGAEIVSEGVDPRLPVLAEDQRSAQPGSSLRVGRLFVYQRNLERTPHTTEELEIEIARAIEAEIEALRTAEPTGSGPGAKPPAVKPGKPRSGGKPPGRAMN